MKIYKTAEDKPLMVSEFDVMYETAVSTPTSIDVLDSLTFSQQRSLETALNQLNSGNFVPHSEVVKMSRLWLMK